MKLITDRMRSKLEELMGFCFIGNSILDNCVYQLDVKFVMPRTSGVFHEGFAHKLPLLADDITDYTSSRGVYLHRPVVPANMKDYGDTKTLFDDILSYMVDFEALAFEAIVVAEEENDRVTKLWLEKFMLGLIPFTKMAIDIVDYIEANGHTPKDNMSTDARVERFLGVGGEEDDD